MEAHRATYRIPAVATLAALLALVLVGPVATANAAPTPTTAPLAPVLPAPPPEVSPFSAADQFCTREQAPPAPAALASAPGVTSRGITVVVFVPPAGTVPAGDPPSDAAAVATRFGALINGCGGIHGRTVDLHLVPTTADPESDCAHASAQYHPFAFLAWGAFDASSCAAAPIGTVTIESGASVPDAALARTQGRLAVGATTRGVTRARLLDLIESDRLDGERVAVVTANGGRAVAAELRRILAAADPSRHIAVAPRTTSPAASNVDVVLTTAYTPATARLTRVGKHPLAVYTFGNATDARLDGLGPVDARRVADAELYGWITPELARYRSGSGPSSFARMCASASETTAPGSNDGSTTTTAPTTSTAPPTLPGGAYGRVTRICLAMRTLARALYAAGPNPTQSSLIRALYRLPNVDVPFGGAVARPNQVVNEPPIRVQHVVVLAQARTPCPHPVPPNAAPALCWAPVPGWTDGHAVNARL